MKTAELAIALLMGCTHYGPLGFKGGYVDAEHEKDVHFVGYYTNAWTHHGRTYEGWNMRAREVCRGDYTVLSQTADPAQHGIYASLWLPVFLVYLTTSWSPDKHGVVGIVRCVQA